MIETKNGLHTYKLNIYTTRIIIASGFINRVARVGEEFREAARRRAWMKREEERTQEERKAFWQANVRARGVMRGQFPLT